MGFDEAKLCGDTKSRPAVPVPARRPAPLDRLSWDSLRLLLAIAESGSFRSAALVAGVALNTIRSKVDRLERQFAAPLLRRSVEGVTLTQEGYELVSIARQMRVIGQGAERIQGASQDRPGETLRVAATEGLGTFWVMPRLVEFRRDHPALRVEMTCDMALPDVLFRDVDIAVQLSRPANPALVVERLATLHVMPFAADSYLRDHAMPTSLADAPQHKLVWQRSDQLATDTFSLLLDARTAGAMVAVETNTSSAHYWAVAGGAGIGLLPTYVAALDQSLRPLDVGVQLRRDLYLVRHPETASAPHVEDAVAWLRAAFDPVRYPWFADAFVHPRHFVRGTADPLVTDRLRGMIHA